MATKVLWFPLLVLVLLMAMVLPTSTCPTRCACSGTLVNCFEKGLVAVPTGIPTTTTNLDLFSNQISLPPVGVFDKLVSLTYLSLDENQMSSLLAGVFDKLVSLTTLSLNDNQISSLPAGVFDKLVSLTELSLVDNQISSLPAGVFGKLVSLTRLYLDYNQISSLPVGVFDKLVSLTRLTLDYNQISSLPAGVFDKLVSLKEFILEYNQISSLPAGVFDKLGNLTYLALGDNPFILEESLCALHYARNNVRHVGLDDSVQRSAALQGSHLQCNNRPQLCFTETPQHLFCSCNVTEIGSFNETTTHVYNGTACVTAVTCPGPVSCCCFPTPLCTVNNSHHVCYCPPGRALKQGFCVPAELPTTFPTISSRTATPSSIRIAWRVLTAAETNGKFLGYTLYFRQVGAGQYQSISTTMNFYTLNGLEPNKVFQFRISASNSYSEGPSSPIRSQATQQALPSFTNLEALSGTVIRLTWTTPDIQFNGNIVPPDEVYYQLRYYKDSERSNYRDVDVSDGGGNTYNVSKLSINTNYIFLVRQIYDNGSEVGDFSSTFSAKAYPTPVATIPTATILSSVAGGLVATILIVLIVYGYRKSRPVTVPPRLLTTLQFNAAYGATWTSSQRPAALRPAAVRPAAEPIYEYIDGEQEDYGYADPDALQSDKLNESNGKDNDKENPRYSTMQMTVLNKKSEEDQTTAEKNDETNMEELSVGPVRRGSFTTDNDQHPNNDLQHMAMNGAEGAQESSQPMLHHQAANSQPAQIIVEQWGSETEGRDQAEIADLSKAAPSGLCPDQFPVIVASHETDQETNPEQCMEDNSQPELPSETDGISTNINHQQPSIGYCRDGKQRSTRSGLSHAYLDVKDAYPETDQATVPEQGMTQPQIPSSTDSKSSGLNYQPTNAGEDGDDKQQTAGHDPTTGLSHDYLEVMDGNQDPEHSTIGSHTLVEDDDAEANTTPTCQHHEYVDLIDGNQQPYSTDC